MIRSMSHTVHVICETTEFNERVTVAEDALVLDVLARAGLTSPMDLLTYTPVYYRRARPVSASILHSVSSLPEGETLFIHEREP